MKKTPCTVYLRPTVRAFVERRLKDAIHPYRSLNEYIEAAILYDIIVGLPHPLLSNLMGRPDWAREKLFEELMEKAATGDLSDEWLKGRLQEIVADPVKKQCTLCNPRLRKKAG